LERIQLQVVTTKLESSKTIINTAKVRLPMPNRAAKNYPNMI
jgi:hypothetical protein